MCETLHIPVVGVAQFEADDVLATLATWGRDAELPVVVVSGDRDTFQLVEDPYIRVLYNRRGVSDYSLYDEAGIFERCGVEARRYPLLAALRGDTSDNLPGVPGVGEKTAAKLLSEYRDFDDLYTHLDALTPKLRENLAAYEERARNNERVMRLVRDVPLECSLEDLTLGGWRQSEVNAFFERYEMNSVRARMLKLMQEGRLGDPASDADAVSPVPAPAPSRELVRGVSLATLLEKTNEPVVAFSTERAAVLDARSGAFAAVDVGELLEGVGAARLAGHDVKELFRWADGRGLSLQEPSDDTSIMAFLVDAISGHYDLADVAQRFLGETAVAAPSLFGAANDETLEADVLQVARLRDVLRAEIERWELQRVYHEIESATRARARTHGGAGHPRRRGTAAQHRRGVRHGGEGSSRVRSSRPPATSSR